VNHNGEVILFEDDLTEPQIQVALHRLDQQRAAVARAFQRRETMGKIREWWANEEAQAAQDEATITQARAETFEARQHFAELARQEEQARLEQEALRRAEATEQERLDSPRSYVEILNDRNREKMKEQDLDE
jgi:hypothetical protein